MGADLLERHCRSLTGRHLPLIVLLQDDDLHAAVPDHLADATAFWQAGAAASILAWRQGVIDRLTAHGCLVVDTPPSHLTPRLVSRYLDIKARNLL